MLCLTRQVSSRHAHVSRFIRNDGGFRGPGQHVNAYAAKQGALGLSHKAIARPHNHVSRSWRVQAKSHCGNALHAPQRQHGICATELHGVQDRRVHTRLIVTW